MDVQIAVWLIGGLFGVVMALVGVIYSSHSREISTLRRWRHEVVDPMIRLTGYLKEQIERLERRIEELERRLHDREGHREQTSRHR